MKLQVQIPHDHPDYSIWLLARATEEGVCRALSLAESGGGTDVLGEFDDLDSEHADEGDDLTPAEQSTRRWRAIANTLEQKFKTKHGCHYTEMITRLCDKWGMEAPYRYLGFVGIK